MGLPGADTAAAPLPGTGEWGEGPGERGRFPGTKVRSQHEQEVTLEVSGTQKERTGAARSVWQR